MSQRGLCALCEGFACDFHPERAAVTCGPASTGAHGRKCLPCARQIIYLATRCFGQPMVLQ